MGMTEKAAYLKGLMDGLNLDSEKKETKLFQAIIDTIGDMAGSVEELEDTASSMEDELDEIAEELLGIEHALDGDCCDDEDCDCCDEDEYFYQVECPTCGEKITVDETLLEQGSIQCPNCGEDLEFELGDGCCDEDGCDCCK